MPRYQRQLNNIYIKSGSVNKITCKGNIFVTDIIALSHCKFPTLPSHIISWFLGFRWLGGVVVRALDSRCAGRVFDSHAAAALPGNNLGQVVHTNVPLFTKQ